MTPPLYLYCLVLCRPFVIYWCLNLLTKWRIVWKFYFSISTHCSYISPRINSDHNYFFRNVYVEVQQWISVPKGYSVIGQFFWNINFPIKHLLQVLFKLSRRSLGWNINTKDRIFRDTYSVNTSGSSGNMKLINK